MEKRTVRSNGRVWQVSLRDQADKSVCAEIFQHREYRAAENTIKEAPGAILDVGAHSGLFTLYARSLNATAPIIAVEPEPNNISLLKRHLALNAVANVSIFAGALSEKSGTGKLVVSPDSHNHRLLLPDEHTSSNTIPVRLMSFADVCAHFHSTEISLMKLDIEGGEYAVFDGMDAADFAHLGAVIMEYHTLPGKNYKSIEKKLRENGFGVQVFPSHFDRTMGFLFAVRKRKNHAGA